MMPACRVLEQHWDVVEPMSTRADWVSYHYYVGLLKISEDKASWLLRVIVNRERHENSFSIASTTNENLDIAPAP